MDTQEKTEEQAMNELLNSLGKIHGVSELTIPDANLAKTNCPVLVADNALFFLAWE